MPKYEAKETISLGILLVQDFTAGLEQLPVFNAGGTDLFASATTETPVYVRSKSVGSAFQTAFGHRTHEVQTAAWSIVLVTGDDVGRTRFETQPAVNAGEELFFQSRVVSRG